MGKGKKEIKGSIILFQVLVNRKQIASPIPVWESKSQVELDQAS